MGNLNKFMVLGRLTKDPELRSINDNTHICEFTIATNDRYKDKNGNLVEETEFHNFLAWNKQAEIINQYKKKGDEILVTAKKKTSKWKDKETGEPRSRIEFHVIEFEFVGSNGKQDSKDNSTNTSTASNSSGIPLDENLPF